jgi:hypothetical protein
LQYIREGAQAKKSYEDKFGAKVSRLRLAYNTTQRLPVSLVSFGVFACRCSCVAHEFTPFCSTSTYQQGAKAGAKAASKEWEEEAPAEGADAKAVADAKEVSRGGAAAAKVRAYTCFVALGCAGCVGLTRVRRVVAHCRVPRTSPGPRSPTTTNLSD